MSENAPSQTLAGRYVGPTAATPYRSGKIPHGRTAADRIGADAHVRRRPLDGARSGTDAIRPGIPERATGRRDIRRSPRSVRCPRGAAVASRRYPRVGRSTENSGSGHCRTRRRTPHAAGHGADRISARPTGRGRRSGRPGTVHRRRHRLPCLQKGFRHIYRDTACFHASQPTHARLARNIADTDVQQALDTIAVILDEP